MHLTEEQLSHFNDEGYVIARNLLEPAQDLKPVIDEYADILNDLIHRMYSSGELSETYEGLPFHQRTLAVVRDTGHLDPYPFDINVQENLDLSRDSEFHFGPAMFRLLRNERLLDAVESILGPEIYSNPVQHVRIKVPEHLIHPDRRSALNATTGWHQDNGVIDKEADETDMLTVWIALTNATERQGCLKLVPQSHSEGLRVHCPIPSEGSRIPPQLIPEDRVRSVPMSQGDVLFMHRRCMHASLTNISDEIRWSLDIRYNPIGQSTGREHLPGFVARSRSNPGSELLDPIAWRQSWIDACEKMLASAKHGPRSGPKSTPNKRWSRDHELCA
ncbi:MAG: phytanoyl-CoA dioxygenase [Chloroflexi bacterium]|nr:phytanoyl-CoA dioxygenase [Chloroflexota bacterium]HCU72423.1 phytanoyl-CoA dioxygenase [Chloroflexota bacterium]|tara:strand:+ start:784 stop:1779 length:996 start_codon:yes stop_codon:yes gene_type:complete